MRILLAMSLFGTLFLFGACGGSSSSPNSPAATPPTSQGTLSTDKILFTYKTPGGNSEIYSSQWNGAEATRLTHDPTYDAWWPRPSPDRRKIIYYRAPAGSNENYGLASLMIMDFDGSNPQVLIPQGTNGWAIQAHAEWSPSGSELVMCGTQGGVVHVFVTNSAGAVSRQLTNSGGWNCDPSWSPNGQKIVFNRCVGANCHGTYGNLDIFVMNAADGSGITPLTNADGNEDYDPYFSPDGLSIAWLYQANNAAWSGLGAWAIKKMNANGTGQIFLTNDGNINSKPAWSLDGSKIFFHRMAPLEATKWRLFYFFPDGSGRTEILPFGPYTDAGVGQASYPAQ